jgi:hypothetical protein
MSRIKMDQLVRWDDGTVATPRAMLDSGRAEVRVIPRFQGSARAAVRKATFVDRIGTRSGVEVSGYVKLIDPVAAMMSVEDACRWILGRHRADSLIAEMGLRWAIVAAMAQATQNDNPEAVDALRRT